MACGDGVTGVWPGLSCISLDGYLRVRYVYLFAYLFQRVLLYFDLPSVFLRVSFFFFFVF
jgi:hypothetical protein